MNRLIVVTAAAAVFFLTAATIALGSPADKQSPYVQTVYELLLNDGSRVYGQIEGESETEVVFRTASGVAVTTPRTRIASLRPVVGRMIRGEFRREDPNGTRLAFGPTGRALPRGQAYLGVYSGFAPFVQVGLTNRFSIGAGTPLVFGDDWDRPYWVSPKLQVYAGNGNYASVGVLHAFAGDENVGIGYGVFTKETSGGAFTLGAGAAYSSQGVQSAVAMVGGEAPFRRNIKWITENYAWDGTVVSSGGFRFFGERLAADLVLAFAFTDSSTFAFPVVNFVYRF
jgi:hypothetical protein